MIDLSILDLDPWEKETLRDLIEDDCPNLLNMSSEELTKLSKDFFWKAQSAYERVCLLESKAEIIALLAQSTKESKE